MWRQAQNFVLNLSFKKIKIVIHAVVNIKSGNNSKHSQSFVQPEIKKYNPLAEVSLEELKEIVGKEKGDLSKLIEGESYRWMVLQNGNLVGNVSLKNVNITMNTAEIGYGVAEEHHRKGIGTNAVRLLVDKVFSETHLRKLFAHVHSGNTASCRLLERIGFKREGVLREHYLVNGMPVDEVFYGLLRREAI